MALNAALLKDFERQLPDFNLDELPTLDARKEFVATQIEATEKIIYRTLIDLEVARAYAAHKDKDYNETAKARFQESIATLKSYKVTLAVLNDVAKQLSEATE